MQNTGTQLPEGQVASQNGDAMRKWMVETLMGDWGKEDVEAAVDTAFEKEGATPQERFDLALFLLQYSEQEDRKEAALAGEDADHDILMEDGVMTARRHYAITVGGDDLDEDEASRGWIWEHDGFDADGLEMTKLVYEPVVEEVRPTPEVHPRLGGIIYVGGSIFDVEADALVAPVNCVGVMGKGLALEFAERIPRCLSPYQVLCRNGAMVVGHTHYLHPIDDGHPGVFYLPTKDHWKNPSQLEWVRDGLVHLRDTASWYGVRSVAIPRLGCGLGGLAWKDVRDTIRKVFCGSYLEVIVVSEEDAEVDVTMRVLEGREVHPEPDQADDEILLEEAAKMAALMEDMKRQMAELAAAAPQPATTATKRYDPMALAEVEEEDIWPHMGRERWNKIQFGEAALSDNEVDLGWHQCSTFGQLIHTSWQEFGRCRCTHPFGIVERAPDPEVKRGTMRFMVDVNFDTISEDLEVVNESYLARRIQNTLVLQWPNGCHLIFKGMRFGARYSVTGTYMGRTDSAKYAELTGMIAKGQAAIASGQHAGQEEAIERGIERIKRHRGLLGNRYSSTSFLLNGRRFAIYLHRTFGLSKEEAYGHAVHLFANRVHSEADDEKLRAEMLEAEEAKGKVDAEQERRAKALAARKFMEENPGWLEEHAGWREKAESEAREQRIFASQRAKADRERAERERLRADKPYPDRPVWQGMSTPIGALFDTRSLEDALNTNLRLGKIMDRLAPRVEREITNVVVDLDEMARKFAESLETQIFQSRVFSYDASACDRWSMLKTSKECFRKALVERRAPAPVLRDFGADLPEPEVETYTSDGGRVTVSCGMERV